MLIRLQLSLRWKRLWLWHGDHDGCPACKTGSWDQSRWRKT